MTIQKTRAQRQQSKTAYCWLCSIGSEGDKYTREREEEKQSYVQLAKLTRIFAMDSIDIKSLKITILLKYWRMKWTSRAFHDCNCFETKAQAIWSNNLLFTVKSWQMCCCLIFVFIYLTRKEKRYNWTWQEWTRSFEVLSGYHETVGPMLYRLNQCEHFFYRICNIETRIRG